MVYICYGRSFESGLLSCLPKNVSLFSIVYFITAKTVQSRFNCLLCGICELDVISFQTINATEIVQRVPGLTSLRTFGFSLSSGVDVDGNKYNGLFPTTLKWCLNFIIDCRSAGGST